MKVTFRRVHKSFHGTTYDITVDGNRVGSIAPRTDPVKPFGYASGDLYGWYWYARHPSTAAHRNTASEPKATLDECKMHANAWLKEAGAGHE